MNQTDPTAESVEERVARHLAARDWLTDDDRWPNATAAFRADYLTAAREVIALVQPPAVSAVVSPPTDRATWLTDAERTMLTYALDQAQEKIWSENGFTDEDQAAVDSLRRLAVEHGTGTQQQPEAPVDRAAVERAFAERLAAELKGCCQECDACIEIAQHMAGSEGPAPVAQQPAAVPQRAYPDCERCGNTSIDPERDGAEPCPECQQAAAADDEETPFLIRVLEIFSLSHADAYGDLFWRVDNGQVHLSANVSDVFAWGGADTEPITPEALPALEQAYTDLKALNAEHFTAELYAARQRRERPQGAAYPDERDQSWREVSALLDACGPERQLGLGNPKAAPAHREPQP